MPHPFSIRTTLLLTIGLLTTLIAVIALREVYREQRQLQKVEILRDATLVSEQYFDVIEQVAREREVTYATLRAKDAAVMEILMPRMASIRQEVNTALTALKTSLVEHHIKKHTAAKLHAHLIALRQEVDRALNQEGSRDEKFLASHWFQESTQELNNTYSEWMDFTKGFTGIDPIITQRMLFQHFLGLIIRYSGRERAVISGQLVAAEPLSASDQAKLLRWRGIIDQGWEMCARLTERSGLAPEITPYLRDTQSDYSTAYDMVEELFYIPGAPPLKSYPIEITQWLEVADGSSDSLKVLKNQAIQKTRAYVSALEEQAHRSIALHALILVAALTLCFISFRVIILRVIEPIRQMVRALLDASAGKPATPPPAISGRGDELDQLAQVLFNLQKTMASRSLLASIVESSDDAIISLSLQGAITSWNHGAEEIFGYTAEEAIGQHINLLIPEERRDEERQIVTQLRAGEQVEHMETVRLNKARMPIDVSLTVSLIVNTRGEIVGTSKIVRDVRARKAAEERLKRYMQDLEHSNKELDDFAYIASHDLKEPLRGIHNHSRFLLEDNEGKLDKDSIDRLHRLLYLTQRMEKLVNDLLYFSRLGRQELAIQPTDLNAVIQDIEATIELLLAERHATLSIPTPLPTVVCDKLRITEALRNLITNAIKYNDKAEKIIEIGVEPQRQNPQGKTLYRVFYVKDNGVGIAQEFYTEVFRIFKRLQNSKVNATERGTGVGLTFVKKIIERHGGEIWLESQLGKGTTFYFTLEKKL